MRETARAILGGNLRALARTATGIENRDAEALEVLRELKPQAGRAAVVGITGAPGAGKSTLVDALARALRAEGKTAGILAVDPSSRVSGGAILGDRVRMQAHHADPGIFIRSMATRGELGGLAQATGDLATLLDAAGRDYVIIETVGVGQDEVEIAGLAQITVVVLVPNMGDDIQALKAGIMEIADIFVINKSDHPGAERVEREIRAEAPHTPIVKTVASQGAGIAELLQAIHAARKTGPRPPGHIPRTGPRFGHLGIAVPALDAAEAFYQQVGLKPTQRETVAQEKVRVAMLPAGLELLEPTGPDSPISRFLEERGGGLHHLALLVPDLAAVVERLRASGARLLNEPRRGAGGHLYVFVHPASTGGVLLELIQDESADRHHRR